MPNLKLKFLKNKKANQKYCFDNILYVHTSILQIWDFQFKFAISEKILTLQK